MTARKREAGNRHRDLLLTDKLEGVLLQTQMNQQDAKLKIIQTVQH